MSVSLTAGQTEATVGMAVSCPISQENPSPVFGLPANLCKLCPQYDHAIIFPRRCYNEMQCPAPLIFYRLKTRAGNTAIRGRVLVKGELQEARKETETELSDAGEQGRIGDSNPESERPGFVGSVTSGGIPAAVPDSHNLPVLIHGMKTAETAAHSPTLVAAQNFPQVLATLLPPRRPALNLFKRFLAWTWSKSAFNDPTREMTCFGWRRRQ